MKTEKEKCKKIISDPTGWHHYKCSRNAWKDGYCKQHHPDTVKVREQAKRERWEEKCKQSSWYRLEQAEKRIAELESEISTLRKNLALATEDTSISGETQK